MSTFTFTYSRTHTSVFVADNMRNVLRDIVMWSGLDSTKLIDQWSVIGRAIQTWLRSDDLLEIVIEFFVPGLTNLRGRWDFPIQYDGSGNDDDMWVARDHIRRTIEKAGRPPANAAYEIILVTRRGRPDVSGMGPATLRSTEGFISRTSGTAIATPDIMASIKYWRAA